MLETLSTNQASFRPKRNLLTFEIVIVVGVSSTTIQSESVGRTQVNYKKEGTKILAEKKLKLAKEITGSEAGKRES